MSSSLTIKAGRSAIWQILGGGAQTVIRLVASIFLARALKPSDFGLFGMAVLVQEFFSYLGALGVGTGIIAKKEATEDDYNTCFWMIATVRFFLFVVTFSSAPLVASFFNDLRLIPIVRAVSFCFLFQIFGAMPQFLLSKNLRFGTINFINLVGVFIESFLAVFLAIFVGISYWSLVVSMLFYVFFVNVFYLIFSGWVPKFRFNKRSFRYLFRFGVYGWAFSITNYLRQNIDYFLVGRLLGAYQLGLYEFAYRIPHLIFVRISQPVGSVIFPVISKVQDDNKKIFEWYIKSVKLVALIAFPVLFSMVAVADVLVPVLWGDQWLPIVKPMQVLCFCAALRCLFQPLSYVFYCKNRPDIPFKESFFTLIFTVILVFGLGKIYGLIGVAFAMLFSVFPSFLVFYFAFSSFLRVNVIYFFKELSFVFFVSFVVLVLLFLCKILFRPVLCDIQLLLILGFFVFVIYLSLVFLLSRYFGLNFVYVLRNIALGKPF